jgi:hypothetical protein
MSNNGLYLVVFGSSLFYVASVVPREPVGSIVGISTAVTLVLAGIAIVAFGGHDRPVTLAAPTTGDLENAIEQLNKNYEVQRKQANQGFVLACVFMTLGLLVILTGSVGDLFGFTREGNGLVVIAGVLTEFIAATGLAVYYFNSRRLNRTHDRLHESWRVLTAFRQAKELPETRRGRVQERLLEALVRVHGKRGPTRKPKTKNTKQGAETASGDDTKNGTASD